MAIRFFAFMKKMAYNTETKPALAMFMLNSEGTHQY